MDEIGYYLQGHMPGTNVSQGRMPDKPDRCAMVRGTDLNPCSKNGERVQILVRGDPSPTMALTDAETVAGLLMDYEGLMMPEGHYIQRIIIENGPSHIGVDQNKRQEYTINLRVFYCE